MRYLAQVRGLFSQWGNLTNALTRLSNACIFEKFRCRLGRIGDRVEVNGRDLTESSGDSEPAIT